MNQELIGTAVQAIVAQAQSLGLTWVLRLATVVASSGTSGLTVVLDGDTITISAVNASGHPMVSGARVYALMTSVGNYIIGHTETFCGVAAYSAASSGGTIASATYANLPGSPSVILTTQPGSALLVTLHTSLRSDAANNVVDLAVLFGSTDLQITKFAINPANTHLSMGGQVLIPSTTGGRVTLTARWRRIAGAGTLSQDANDWVSLTAQTCAAI